MASALTCRFIGALDGRGRFGTEKLRIHTDLTVVRVGDEVYVANRRLRAMNGRILGALARKCEMPNGPLSGVVHAVMVRTRNQTRPEYLASIKVETWEVPLAEIVIR